MRRPSPQRQQGFGLLVFVIATAIVALSIVLGYSGILARAQANQLVTNQEKYLAAAKSSVLAFYERNAYAIDERSMSNTTTIAQILAGANVPVRYDLQSALSNVLVSPEGLSYRVVALWLPSETDATNPPNISNFISTGNFISCSNASSCAARQVQVFDSASIERDKAKRTNAQLMQIAMKAQSYFKARLLQDPERNVSVNYFRAPAGVCQVQPMDLECLNVYTPLATSGAGSAAIPSTTAKNLGLSDAELVSAWGRPIEASNLIDSFTDDTPYAMSFRAATPAGTFYKIKAVEQL
jgi:type II secretory pathway pseudopilin PulG